MSHLKVNAAGLRQVSVDLPNVAASGAEDAQVTAPRCKVGEMYLVSFEIGATGLPDDLLWNAVAQCRVKDTLDLRISNPSIIAVNATAATMTYIQL